jgi:hypothetical protein
MPANLSNLFLLQDLDDPSRTNRLADRDLNALFTVADWIKTFLATPNRDLGRAGPVCPFVPGALERKTLWLAPERIDNLSVPELAELLRGYRNLLQHAQPIDGDDAAYKAIVVVFTDLSADRAREHDDNVQIQNFRRLSYFEDGVVSGEFHMKNEGSAIRNRSFQPFKSPVPFWLMRNAVVSDWMFFLENEEWLGSWARRFGESAVHTLADELRRTNWRWLVDNPVARS